MKKRFLSILLVLCMVLCLMPTTAFAEGNVIKEVATADELISAMADTSIAVVKLTADIDIDSTLNTNHDITLDLNGCVLKMTGDDRVIQVNNAFTLTDSSPQTEHKFSQSSMFERWVLDEVNGDKIVNGGVITGVSDSGGGVIVENGSFTMKGGNIAGCSADFGGGVYAKSSFTMEGGAIVGCKAFNLGGNNAYGGGVYLTENAGFTLDGGTITDCTAYGFSNGNGGGLYCARYSSDQHYVSIKSGTIKNCKAYARMNRTYGGGVFIDTTKFEMSGGLIQQCEAESGGGLCVFGGKSAVFSGGRISECKAAAQHYEPNGGGIYIGGTAFTMKDNAVIEKCEAEEGRGGGIAVGRQDIDYTDPGKFIMEGGKITECKATGSYVESGGGGVYVDCDNSLNRGMICNGGIITGCSSDSKISDAIYIKSGRIRTDAGKSGTIFDGTAKNTATIDGGIFNKSVVNTDKITHGMFYGGITNEGSGVVDGLTVTYRNKDKDYAIGVLQSGETATAPIAPTEVNHTFDGWYDGDTKYDFTLPVTQSLTLTSQFAPNTYSLTLNTNGGTIAGGKNITEYTYGEGATLPTADDITYTGHTFKGWYDNEGLTGSPVTSIGSTETGNKEYWAKWEVSSYTVTLNANGGTINNGNVTGYTFGQGATLPTADDMTYTGYTFKGWYDNEGFTGSHVTSIGDTETGNKEYWAKWEANTYSVTLNTNGGTIANGKNVTGYTYGQGATLPTADDMTYTGHTFKGWYDNEGFAGSPVTSISNTETGNKQYWAKWEINQYTVTVKPETGEADITITQDYGTPITTPVLTREGYRFNGWDKAFPATMPAGDLTITAQWLDVETPTGEIKLAGNGWKTFLNNITFGLFFKDTQKVTITAADNSGEAVTIGYLLSNKELTGAELAKMAFTEYTAPFHINPDNEYVVYAKLTDTSGNAMYINTDGIVLDATVPGISGIENGKTYCAAQTVTVDEKYIGTVTVNGKVVTLDSKHQFTLNPAEGTQTIAVTDKAGNKTTVSVTANDGHTYEWKSGNGQYWQKCKFCGDETAKKAIPAINISGADKVCRTQDYKFGFTLPEGATDADYGYEFIGKGDEHITPTLENGRYSGIIKAAAYPAEENSFRLILNARTTDGFAFSVKKTVTIQNEHSGGTATCKDRAICEACGESYGELNANNHADLKHIDAKAATGTAGGNIEYWYCSDCKKYYKDAAATKEIAEADTATAKEIAEADIATAKLLKANDSDKSPKTGDNTNLTLWIALLLASGGAGSLTTVVSRKKKRSVK